MMKFLKLVLRNKPVESSSSHSGIVVVVGRTINGVFSEVEVTREDSVSGVIVTGESSVSQRLLSEP